MKKTYIKPALKTAMKARTQILAGSDKYGISNTEAASLDQARRGRRSVIEDDWED